MAAICDTFPIVSKYMSNFPSNADVIFTNGMYPLKIKCCNAMESTSFCKAFITCTYEEGFPMIFFTDLNKLADYLQSTKNDTGTQQTEDFGKAVKRLENFLSESKKHENCISLLKNNDETPKHAFQVTLAEHLFGPLSGDETVQIGNLGFTGSKKCQTCRIGKYLTVCDTSFGNSLVWHGYADIFVKRSIVKIAENSNEDIPDDSYESSEELGSGKPSRKRRRTDSLGDDSSSDESSIGSTNQSALSQALAQTIVNAFCVANENNSFSNSFIPSFIATNRKVRICMYNCEQDVLFLSGELDIFSGQSFNFFTIFLVWYFLNFRIVKGNNFTESNFKKILGEETLQIYQSKVSRPMTKEEGTKLQLHIKKIDDPVIIDLYTTVTAALGKLKKLPSEKK